MEKIKLIFKWIGRIRSPTEKKEPEETKYDHVVTIEELEGRTEISRATPEKNEKKKRNRKVALLVDFLFCALVTLLWVTAFSYFVRFSAASPDTPNSHEYFYFSYFIIVVIVSVTSIHFESLILKGFDKFSPKIAIMVNKSQNRAGPYILRLRVANVSDREFIETELDETKLTYEHLLEVCCKELELEKDNIVRLRKIPETKIRNDDDIKRFRRLEYLEVITQE